MAPEYDAIVVGARCAGSPTAMLLARKGYRVLLVDRATLPSDTLSTHFIHQPGVASLDRWGLLPEVVASNCPPVRKQTLDVGPLAIVGAAPAVDGIAEAYCVRRTVLDEILIRAAAAAGAEVREHFSVHELVTDGDRVTGVRGHGADGEPVTEHAKIVIGADGLNSIVARGVDAPMYHDHPTKTCAYFGYWSDVDVDHVELYSRPGQMIIAGPTNDGMTMVIIYWPTAEFHTVRADIERHFAEALDTVPGLADRIRKGTRSERFRGTGRLPNFFRRPFGDGWALVGDAGYHKDPILALGISDAFRDAELLAGAVDAGLSGRETLAVALQTYENRRNTAAAQGYENTLQFAALEPPPAEMQQLFGALRHSPEQVSRFFGTAIGTYPAATFFAPDNIEQIMIAAATAAA